MAPRKKKIVNPLLDAVNFVSFAQVANGLSYQQHCQISDGYIVATDGVTTAGHPAIADVQANAHTKTLKNALARCGEQFNVTYYDNDRLKVHSGKFSAFVPCLPAAQMLPLSCDSNVAALTPEFFKGLGIVAPLATESAKKVAYASVLVNPNSMAATDGIGLIEYWHGIDLPPSLLLPAKFVNIVLKVGEKPTGFGYGGGSITLHYRNGAFLKTQLYKDPYPDIGRILNVNTSPKPVPKGLLESCKVVADFTDVGTATTLVDLLCSHETPSEGASVEQKGLPPNMTFSVTRMLDILPHMKTVDFTNDRCIYFFGDNVRAAISKKTGVN